MKGGELRKVLIAISDMAIINKQFEPFNLLKNALKNNGVKLFKSKNGLCPDFSKTPKYLAKGKVIEGGNIVKIKITPGKRNIDIRNAWKKSNFNKIDFKDYTWHHIDDYNPITEECTMQLVERQIHEWSYPHTGAVAQLLKYLEIFN